MANNREIALTQFLEAHGWDSALRKPIDGDASFRRYERLEKKKQKAILMDAPPPKEDVRPFIKIAHYLREMHLSAPRIYAQDEEQGFLVLEDLGNDSYTRLLNGNSSLSKSISEEQLYRHAIDVLIKLHQAKELPQNTAPYDDAVLKREVLLLIDWYLPYIGLYNEAELVSLREEYLAIWSLLYSLADSEKKVTVYRDYHADNLMWLPERENEKAVGLLDFQDALIGSQAYDLVSLLEDARRDVSPVIEETMLDYFIEKSSIKDSEAFRTSYAVLGAQRNSKIIGIFCRLAIRDGKERYLSYLPRVWSLLEHNLEHPALTELKSWFDRVAPVDKRNPVCITLPSNEAARA